MAETAWVLKSCTVFDMLVSGIQDRAGPLEPLLKEAYPESLIPLIKEYALNHTRMPSMVPEIFPQ